MGGIFTQTDIGNDEERRKAGADEPDCFNHRSGRVVGCCAKSVLYVWCNWNSEKDDGPEAFANKGLKMSGYFVEPTAMLVRKGWNQGFFVGLVGDEKGIYQH